EVNTPPPPPQYTQSRLPPTRIKRATPRSQRGVWSRQDPVARDVPRAECDPLPAERVSGPGQQRQRGARLQRPLPARGVARQPVEPPRSAGAKSRAPSPQATATAIQPKRKPVSKSGKPGTLTRW